MDKQGICSFPYTPATLPLANTACLVAGAYAFGGALPYVISLAFHPTAKVSTPIAGEFPSAKLTTIESTVPQLQRFTI